MGMVVLMMQVMMRNHRNHVRSIVVVVAHIDLLMRWGQLMLLLSVAAMCVWLQLLQLCRHCGTVDVVRMVELLLRCRRRVVRLRHHKHSAERMMVMLSSREGV